MTEPSDIYGVGEPGGRARWVRSRTPLRPQQIGEGRVAVLFAGVPDGPFIGRYTISAEGDALIPVAATLEDQKAARWVEARAHRDSRQSAGCSTPLGRVDTDADSQRKINGAVTATIAASLGGSVFAPIDWTMADNSVVAHDGPALIAMGLAVASYLDVCQQAGTAIRAAIEAAIDGSAVEAVDITAGYPS